VSVARVVRDDGKYAGCPLRHDDRVILCTGAANRDPRQFDDAEKFIGDRSPNRHIAFGAGIHRCLGSHLARLELRIAIEEWLARVPEFEVAPGTELRHHVGGAAGLDNLPLVWR
jgi:cytochrome P450